jgi:hypothetical protein
VVGAGYCRANPPTATPSGASGESIAPRTRITAKQEKAVRGATAVTDGRPECDQAVVDDRTTIRERSRRYLAFAVAPANAERARASARLYLMDQMCENVINGKLDPDCARVALQHYKWAAGVEDRSKYGDRLGVQPVMPTPSVPIAGEITLDRSNPREAEHIVMSVLGML